MLFESAVEAFFISRAPRKDSPHTVAAYRRDLTAIARIVTEQQKTTTPLPCSLFTPRVLRLAFADYASTRAKSSIARAWSTWNTFFAFCVGDGILDGNPMSGVARPKLPDRSPKPLRGEDAAERLLSAIAAGARKARNPWLERDLAVVATLLLTGLRTAELLGLSVGNLAGAEGEQRLVVRGGKGDADRVVPVDVPLERLLAEYLSTRAARLPGERSPLPPRSPLWVDHRGEALTRNQLQYLVKQSYRSAGIDDRVERGALVHALRHTFATKLGQSGASATEIMELLGHRSLAASQGYIKATARELREAARANPTYGFVGRLTGGDRG
ncbi:tyrosine-type recombinase/integrase [Phytomonospora endophytica]|uniref:Integrase/recombinase XerD n=1 Tax=Phytomonospora endophytica TaxID=714109 RepID=A0A841F9G0_9ACTN|nr:tyrosine-type recombinase/integrase [Phytomonospora endophytica]MBB6033821.1 integrase/recombinase XerD [Phytomonospora endophytica]GIG64660.1 integrase [Phytomonospora endophytica]